MKNYYELFGLSMQATEDEIRQVIHRESRIWGQRINSPTPERRLEAVKRLNLLREMEEILLNRQKRIEYDRKLRMSANRLDYALTEAKGLLEQKEYQQALALAERLVRQAPSRADIWVLIAQIYLELDKIDQAYQVIRKGYELAPKSAECLYTLAKILDRRGLQKEAEEKYKEAIAIAPENVEYLYGLVLHYRENKKLLKETELLEQCYELDPENLDFRHELVRNYLKAATQSWKEINESPDLPDGRYPVSKADLITAEEFLNKAKNIPIEDPALQTELHDLLEQLHKSRKREFTGSIWAAVISALELVGVYIVNPSWINIALIFLLPIFYLLSALTPRVRIYQFAFEGQSIRSDFAYWFEALSRRMNRTILILLCVIAIIPYFFTVNILLPIIIIHNFYKNYLKRLS